MATKMKNLYSFDYFLSIRDSLDDFDNPFLQEVFRTYTNDNWDNVYTSLKALSNKTSFRWRKFSEENARIENHPKIRHYDAYNHRIDKIIRPQEMHQLEKEVFSEGLFSSQITEMESAMKRYLLHSNGEAGIMCPLACTDGLIAILEMFSEQLSPELLHILRHAKDGINGDFAIGAQFMSEIQGGSNIPANLLEAVPHDGHYKLFGNKFFCSASHADYSVVTARIQGSNHVSVFIVPTWLEGNKEKNIRNGHVINRLKWKLGTTELPSAEINYDGAIAYQIGPIDKGVALAVSVVLTRSRLDIGFGSASFMMRAAREALLYAHFRDVFGRKINDFPMANAQIEEIVQTAKRATATIFKIYTQYLQTQQENSIDTKQGFTVRELILIQKIYSAKETVDTLRAAISIFGGHGAIEDFSSIPRLFRDSMVNELWEGPKNVLLSQIYRDLQKNTAWYPPHEFMTNLLEDLDKETIHSLSQKLQNLLKINLYDYPTTENKKAAKEWEQLWEDVYLLYQEQALNEIDDLPIINNDVLKSLMK